MKLKPKTPKKVNTAIKNILNELDINESPVYLTLTLSENSRAGASKSDTSRQAYQGNAPRRHQHRGSQYLAG